MRILLASLFFLIATVSSNAQDFLAFKHHMRFEITFSHITATQSGNIYINHENHNPPLYYQPTLIDQKLGHAGIGLQLWYAWNFGEYSFEKVAYGIETGFHMNAGSQDRSLVIPEKAASKNLRLPILLSARIGSAVDPASYGKMGLGLAAGLEVIRTAIANENGTYLLPKVQGLLTYKRLMLTAAWYPGGIQTYYILNGEETERLHSGLVEWSLRYAITWYSKPYRATRMFQKL